jgi:hypothetical protein
MKRRRDLKATLNFATAALDNHLRLLSVALVASHFFHTDPQYAQSMLRTCEQLAAGLGAAPGGSSKARKSSSQGENAPKDAIGNGPMRIWVGERFLGWYIPVFFWHLAYTLLFWVLEIYKRAGDASAVQQQEVANRVLTEAMEAQRSASTTVK